ncbi:MAG TPA: NAD(P)-dependent oxidoreductase [Aquabacterium sp.]|nr:NAD(P)-dependent oxidoreductase [Aquabacterium sp.]HRH27299.1 NAD(P)-dependent oxidoreductase [Aquabacterium sp.]
MSQAPPASATPAGRVAFLGLGTMGAPMALHLLRAGHQVTVYNRTTAKAQAWVAQHGGHWAPSPADAARGAEHVITCVGRDEDLREVTLGAQGAFGAMAPDAVLIDHTTTSAELARELAQAARERGLHFIDAPVSGGNLGAVQGTLTVMCGGDVAVFQRIEPVVKAYARAVTLLGEAGAGQLAKMTNQICVAGVLQGLAEAIAFGQKAGLDMHAVLGVITQGAASSWQMQHRGPTMVDDQFDFGFAVDWMRKDLGLVLDEARRQGASLPLTALIDQFYADVQGMGGGRLDTSSLIKRLR